MNVECYCKWRRESKGTGNSQLQRRKAGNTTGHKVRAQSWRQGGCGIIPMNEKVNLRRIIGTLCFYPAVKLGETLMWGLESWFSG